MNEFEDKIALSRCCNAVVKTNEQQTVLVLLTRSSDMKCGECGKEVMPYELNFQPEYTKIANGIYRKNKHLKMSEEC